MSYKIYTDMILSSESLMFKNFSFVISEEDEALEGSPDLAVSEYDDYGNLDGMKVGPIATGEIPPFSSTKLEIIWNPTVPGKVDTEFLVRFADELSDSVSRLKSLGKIYFDSLRFIGMT